MGYLSELKLPLLGETMESGRITSWCVANGEDFTRGQVLLEVETDKTIVEVPALSQGKLIRITAHAGEQVTVGAVIAEIELEGESPVDTTQGSSIDSAQTASNSQVAVQPTAVTEQSRPANGVKTGKSEFRREATVSETLHQEPLATPRARRMAQQFGIDLNAVTGTGRRQRVTFADVAASVGRANTQHAPQSGLPVSIDVTRDTIETPDGLIHRTHWRGGGRCNMAAGRVVVVLHGLFGDAQVWEDVATRFIKARSGFATEALSVCAIDLPGHGASTCSSSSLHLVRQAVSRAIEDFDEVTLVGHSYGGLVATGVAALSSDKVTGLVLLAPLGLGREIDQQFLDTIANPDSDLTQLGQVMSRLTAGGEVPSAAYIRSLHQRIKHSAAQFKVMIGSIAEKGEQSQAAAADLEALGCPLTIVWGRQDRIIDWHHALAAPEQAGLEILANTGHMLHSEQPARIVQVLARTQDWSR